MAEHAERGGAKERAFHAVRRAVAQHAAGRAAGLAVTFLVIGQVVQEALDLLRSSQAAEHGAFCTDESVRVHRQQSSVVCGGGTILHVCRSCCRSFSSPPLSLPTTW